MNAKSYSSFSVSTMARNMSAATPSRISTYTSQGKSSWYGSVLTQCRSTPLPRRVSAAHTESEQHCVPCRGFPIAGQVHALLLGQGPPSCQRYKNIHVIYRHARMAARLHPTSCTLYPAPQHALSPQLPTFCSTPASFQKRRATSTARGSRSMVTSRPASGRA